VELQSERGSTLVETAVAVAIVSVVAGAALDATILATHAAGTRPVRDALESEVRREMPVAIDVLKYQSGAIAPTSVATTLPMPAGTPLSARVSIAVSPDPAGSFRLTLTAEAGDPTQRVQLTATLGAQAPVPGTIVTAPALAPAPTGAP
jgi:type II secretory pathway pseudopilin PulG